MSPAPISPLIVLALILAPLLAGLILLRKSRRRVGFAPHCPKCDYLLYGNTTAVCPECGQALTPDNIVYGERTRSRPRLITGLLLILAALALTATLGVDTYRRYDWYQLRPTAWLIDEAGAQGRGANPLRAWRELERRMSENKLSANHHQRLTAIALAEQKSANQDTPPKPGSPIIPDLLAYLGQRQLAGQLSPDQSKQFFENSARVKLNVRPTVFKGDAAPIEVAIIATTPTPPWYAVARDTKVTVPGPDGRPTTRPGSGGGSMSGVGASTASIFRVPAPPPGEHEVTVAQVIQIHHREIIITSRAMPLYEFTATAKAILRVVDDATQAIKLINDPAKDPAMQQSVSARHVPADPYRPNALEFRIAFDNPPESIAADVILRWTTEDGRTHEHPASAVYIAKGKNTSWQTSTNRPNAWPPAATTADIVLRPNQKVARETIDLTEMWNREIIIKDVPLTSR